MGERLSSEHGGSNGHFRALIFGKLHRCEHWKAGSRSHLAVFNLQSYNVDYLAALLNNDSEAASMFEEEALQAGYGPLAPCHHTIAIHQQEQFCRK